MSHGGNDLHIYIIAGEESGDRLGSALMQALRRLHGDGLHFSGIGGSGMQEAGLQSLFPMTDIAVNGVSAVLKRLPKLLRRINETVDAAAIARPDILLLIDAPDFTHRVAEKLVKIIPDLFVVQYVSPTVWVWRSGRARKMSRYIDAVMAILPFEPEVHLKLGGPPCLYVGHPLQDNHWLTNLGARERVVAKINRHDNVDLLLMPGSRASEVSRLLPVFERSVHALHILYPQLHVHIPAIEHLYHEIKEQTDRWDVPTQVSCKEYDKNNMFAKADIALIASGTASLELALAGIPMVVAYKLDRMASVIKWVLGHIPGMIGTGYFSLPNIILGRPAFPEFLNGAANDHALQTALMELLKDPEQRHAQLEAMAEIRKQMMLGENIASADMAAHYLYTQITRNKNLPASTADAQDS